MLHLELNCVQVMKLSFSNTLCLCTRVPIESALYGSITLCKYWTDLFWHSVLGSEIELSSFQVMPQSLGNTKI